MAHYLLTGAGFTRNWGGWLADEVFEYILGDFDITPSIRSQLFRDRLSRGNYETTVQALRDRAKTGDDADYKTIIAILSGMFRAMNNAFAPTGFCILITTSRNTPFRLSTFMHKFDVIFTLNQDTLLERQYFTQGFQLSTQNRWAGYDIPGLELSAPNNGMRPDANTPYS